MCLPISPIALEGLVLNFQHHCLSSEFPLVWVSGTAIADQPLHSLNNAILHQIQTLQKYLSHHDIAFFNQFFQLLQLVLAHQKTQHAAGQQNENQGKEGKKSGLLI